MANMLKMMKDAAGMQRQLKKIQKELARQIVTFENAGIKVAATGDMQIASIEIAPERLTDVPAEKLGKQIVMAVNGALAAAKKQAGAEMSKMAGGGGLSSLLGG